MGRIILHLFLFALTGGTYLLLYIPYLVLKSLKQSKTKNRKKKRSRRSKGLFKFRGNRNEGFVYLIRADGTNLYKIGRTNNIKRRLRELAQAQGPLKLNYTLIEFARVKDCVAAERRLHKEFDKYRYNGEWFALERKQLKKALRMFRKL